MSERSCLICRECDDEVNFSTRCDHTFHVSCLDLWFRERGECALCRKQISNIQLIEDIHANRRISNDEIEMESFFESSPTMENINIVAEWAVENGDIQILNELYKNTDFDVGKFMEIAASRGNLDMIKYFVSKNVGFKVSLIDQSAKNGHLEVVKYFVGKGKQQYCCTTDAIDMAARNGHLQVVKYLIKKGKPCTLRAVDWAAGNGHLDVVKYLIEKGNKWCSSDAIKSAAGNGHLEVVKYLFDKFARINSSLLEFDDEYEKPVGCWKPFAKVITNLFLRLDYLCTSDAINSAARNGHLEIVKFLIERGIKYNPCGGGIENAARNGHLDVIKYLIEKGKHCTSIAIDFAAETGHLEIFKYLAERGVPHNQNAIELAANNGHLEAVKCFIELGDEFEFNASVYEKATSYGFTDIHE